MTSDIVCTAGMGPSVFVSQCFLSQRVKSFILLIGGAAAMMLKAQFSLNKSHHNLTCLSD